VQLLAASVAQAAVRLDASGIACDPEEIQRAVALRIPDERELQIKVRAAGPGEAQISIEGKTRVVRLDGKTGSQAARRLALAIVDLALTEAQPLPPPPPPDEPRAVLSAWPTVGIGNSGAQPWVSGRVSASVRLWRFLRGTVAIGYGGGPTASVDGVDVNLQTLPLRVGLAGRPPEFPVEVRVDALIEPYWGRAYGAVRASGTMFGVGAAALFHLPRRKRLQAVIATGLDVFASRVELTVNGQTALGTERVIVWVGVGLAGVVVP